MSIKPDNVVISILNSLYPDIQFIADNGDGVHLKTVFGLVGEVSNKSIGTMRKSIRSKNGKYFHAQPKEYLLNIGVQGNRKSNAYDIAEEIQFLLNTGRYKALFKQKGFSIRVDHQDIDSIPIQMDTSWFVRYQFPIYLTTDVIMEIENDSISGVGLFGNIQDINGNDIYDYEEIINPEPDVNVPTLLNSQVTLNGLQVILTFDEVIRLNQLDLELLINGLSYNYTTQVFGEILTLESQTVIYENDVVIVNYNSGVFDSSNNEAEPFVEDVENNSTVVPDTDAPTLITATVPQNGLIVELTFDENIAVSNLNLSLEVNNEIVSYSHVVIENQLKLIVDSVIYQGETVSIAYTSGISDLSGNEADASKMNVVNNSSVVKPVSDAALAVFGVNDKGVYYDFDDFTMLYQDTTLTNNINAVGQTIAGFKDKSGKGWNCLIPTVSRQPKVGQDAITGARYIMFDRSDDQINQLIGMNFDVSQGLTMIIAADYKTASTTANLNIGLIQQASSWGFAIKGSTNTVRSGVSNNVLDVGANLNWYIGTPLRSIVPSTPTKDCYIMRYNKNTGVKLSANDDYFSEITAVDSTHWVLTNFLMQYTNKNVYKILMINRLLTDAECDAIRTQFNAAMGV